MNPYAILLTIMYINILNLVGIRPYFTKKVEISKVDGYLEVVTTKNDCINLIKHHYLSSVVSFYLLCTIHSTYTYKHITRTRGSGRGGKLGRHVPKYA